MFDKKTPAQKEWEAFLKREKRQLEKFGSRRESFWEKRLASLVPDGLSSKLETAFQRAFEAVSYTHLPTLYVGAEQDQICIRAVSR